MDFDALHLATGWLSVAVASSKDEDRPALNRTVSIETYPTGVLLAATDSHLLLRSWVPSLDVDEYEPEPDLDAAPLASAVAMDPHGRGKGFLAHVRRLATAGGDDTPQIEVSLDLGVVEADEDQPSGSFAGMEAEWVVLELPDSERLKLRVYEGEFPTWRKVIAGFAGATTSAVALHPERLAGLAKLGKFHGDRPIRVHFGGESKMALVDVADSHPRVDGAVMPVRWDFDENLPVDEVDRSDEAGDDDGGDG